MVVRIALAGNPNSGKTTLFNTLTGSNQFVGNWPGVTVEKKEGKLKSQSEVRMIDLPGVYSLSPYTLEEVVARNYLIQERPDVIVNIIDGTNLERSLYLTTQIMELGIPVIMAINMMDIVRKNGESIDILTLSEKMGCEAVEVSALKNIGTDELIEKAILLALNQKASIPVHRFSPNIEAVLSDIENCLGDEVAAERKRFYAVKLFERDDKIGGMLNDRPDVEALIVHTEHEMDDDAEGIITNERYEFITSIIDDVVQKKSVDHRTLSDQIDSIVTNRWLALPIFAFSMWLIYYISVTSIGAMASDWANDGVFGEGFYLFGIKSAFVPGIPVVIEGFLRAVDCAPWLQSLVLNGIVGGVGAVLGFVPQIMILFLFLGFLEGCGYMSRIAFIMDRLFRKFGLSGKSFIPLLVGSGCGVPGIMASRTIESDRDRRMTIMTTTFIPCGAKLPIIALISGALFDGASWVAPSTYFVGITAVVCSGVILKKTRMFAGEAAPFVMELPAYHLPTLQNVLRNMWDRACSFIKKAGTIILLSAVVIWFLENFTFQGGFKMTDHYDESILASLGKMIQWLFLPLGWGQWQAAVAAVTGLVAKENVVGTMGVLYGYTSVAENGQELWETLAGTFSSLTAYSFLVFNLLCAPCLSAMAAIRREMNSRRWFWFAVGYQTALAYGVSLCIYQIGTLIRTGRFGIGTAAAFLVLLLFACLLFRPQRKIKVAKH